MELDDSLGVVCTNVSVLLSALQLHVSVNRTKLNHTLSAEMPILSGKICEIWQAKCVNMCETLQNIVM